MTSAPSDDSTTTLKSSTSYQTVYKPWSGNCNTVYMYGFQHYYFTSIQFPVTNNICLKSHKFTILTFYIPVFHPSFAIIVLCTFQCSLHYTNRMTSEPCVFPGRIWPATASLGRSASLLSRFPPFRFHWTQHLHWNRSRRVLPWQLWSNKRKRKNY